MQRAQVKFFDEKRGFGFLDSTDRVFFHASTHCTVEVVFCRDHHDVQVKLGAWQQPPKAGDWVIYTADKNAKGVYATAWTFDREYRAAVEQAAAAPIYRFVTRYSQPGPWRADNQTRR
ncbi:MAG: cold-shock protein, partial [Candidatus Cryosericum sp.]